MLDSNFLKDLNQGMLYPTFEDGITDTFYPHSRLPEVQQVLGSLLHQGRQHLGRLSEFTEEGNEFLVGQLVAAAVLRTKFGIALTVRVTNDQAEGICNIIGINAESSGQQVDQAS